MDGIMVLTLKEIHLEGQNAEEFIHVPTDILDAMLLPCPYFRRYVIVNGDVGIIVYEAGNLQVEARIVHQYHHIRVP